jgi:hypothetical protein
VNRPSAERCQVHINGTCLVVPRAIDPGWMARGYHRYSSYDAMLKIHRGDFNIIRGPNKKITANRIRELLRK